MHQQTPLRFDGQKMVAASKLWYAPAASRVVVHNGRGGHHQCYTIVTNTSTPATAPENLQHGTTDSHTNNPDIM
jgi:hypothetical protein